MNIDSNLIDICRILNKYSVNYLIVGGAAVAFHGYARLSTNDFGKQVEKPDYDFWYRPDYPNYYGILKSIKDLGIDVSRLMEENAVDVKKAFLKVKDHPDFTLDFLPVLKMLENFSDCYGRGVQVTVDDVSFTIISLEDLMNEKSSSGRRKDIDDFNQLNNLT